MPKTSKAKYTRRYVPRRRSYGATVKKPYGGSRYGNDAFLKVESIQPLATPGASDQVFSTMRVNDPPGLNIPGNTYLANQTEFQNFQVLYSRYEVTGMKAEVTLNSRYQFSAANLAGGFAPRMPQTALFPTEANNVTYPEQKDCNTQGEVSSLYYAYSKDLKNSGNRFAYSTQDSIPLNDQGIVQFRGILGSPTGAAAVVGNIKFTWYVRFHGRSRPAGQQMQKEAIFYYPPRAKAEQAEPQCSASDMSYADLQEHVKQLMVETNRKY